MDLKNDFSLVLSGGSALAIGHLGVIRYFQENKIEPNEIIGTSMGALIGAAYGIGMSYNEIQEIFEKLNFFKLFKLNFFEKNSLISLKSIKSLLEDIFGKIDFKSLRVNLKIIATNVNTGNCEVFDKNNNVSLVDALCASFAIPGIFEPYKIGDFFYWDGFLSSNLSFEFSSLNKIIAFDVININLIKGRKLNSIKSSLERAFFISILNQTGFKVENVVDGKELRIIDIDLSKFDLYDFFKWKEISDRSYSIVKKVF